MFLDTMQCFPITLVTDKNKQKVEEGEFLY